MKRFSDRSAAGKKLGAMLLQKNLSRPVIVLGLPRGGVPVASEVARMLGAPLDVLVVRKIGHPGQSEFAIGAIATGGVLVSGPLMQSGGMLDEQTVAAAVQRERTELERRESVYRAGRLPLSLTHQTVVLIDDGLATGSTMLAAVKAARRLGAAHVICAAPVGSAEAQQRLDPQCDEVVLAHRPDDFASIAEWYDDFPQLEDFEVQRILAAYS